MDHDLLDVDATCAFFGGTRPISRATLYRGIQSGRFPRAAKIGTNTARWRLHELHAARDKIFAERDTRAA